MGRFVGPDAAAIPKARNVLLVLRSALNGVEQSAGAHANGESDDKAKHGADDGRADGGSQSQADAQCDTLTHFLYPWSRIE